MSHRTLFEDLSGGIHEAGRNVDAPSCLRSIPDRDSTLCQYHSRVAFLCINRRPLHFDWGIRRNKTLRERSPLISSPALNTSFFVKPDNIAFFDEASTSIRSAETV